MPANPDTNNERTINHLRAFSMARMGLVQPSATEQILPPTSEFVRKDPVGAGVHHRPGVALGLPILVGFVADDVKRKPTANPGASIGY